MKLFDKLSRWAKKQYERRLPPAVEEVRNPEAAVDPEQPAKTFTGRRARRNVTMWSAEWLAQYNRSTFTMRDGTRYRIDRSGAFINLDEDRRPVKVRKAERRAHREAVLQAKGAAA